MSQSTEEQITQLLSTLKKSIKSKKPVLKDPDSDSELEYEINDVTEVDDDVPVNKSNSACGRVPVGTKSLGKKQIPDEPVGNVSHQKYCIKCGSADNLFRNNKYKTCVVCCNKTKRPGQSENQKKAFERCRAKRLENVQKRKNMLQEFEQQAKTELDSKIVKKAIAVKKKSIIREAQLDEISDDDTPLEEVIQVAKKTESKKRAPRKNVEKEVEPVEEPVESQQQYYMPSFSFA
jgi:hypothetical protein